MGIFNGGESGACRDWESGRILIRKLRWVLWRRRRRVVN